METVLPDVSHRKQVGSRLHTGRVYNRLLPTTLTLCWYITTRTDVLIFIRISTPNTTVTILVPNNMEIKVSVMYNILAQIAVLIWKKINCKIENFLQILHFLNNDSFKRDHYIVGCDWLIIVSWAVIGQSLYRVVIGQSRPATTNMSPSLFLVCKYKREFEKCCMTLKNFLNISHHFKIIIIIIDGENTTKNSTDLIQKNYGKVGILGLTVVNATMLASLYCYNILCIP